MHRYAPNDSGLSYVEKDAAKNIQAAKEAIIKEKFSDPVLQDPTWTYTALALYFDATTTKRTLTKTGEQRKYTPTIGVRSRDNWRAILDVSPALLAAALNKPDVATLLANHCYDDMYEINGVCYVGHYDQEGTRVCQGPAAITRICRENRSPVPNKFYTHALTYAFQEGLLRIVPTLLTEAFHTPQWEPDPVALAPFYREIIPHYAVIEWPEREQWFATCAKEFIRTGFNKGIGK